MLIRSPACVLNLMLSAHRPKCGEDVLTTKQADQAWSILTKLPCSQLAHVSHPTYEGRAVFVKNITGTHRSSCKVSVILVEYE